LNNRDGEKTKGREREMKKAGRQGK